MHTNVYTHTKQAGGRHNRLYKWTLYTHTGALARQLRDGKSRIVVHLVVAKILLSKREKAVKDAVRDVCAQFDREQVHVVPHIWDSNSSADCRWSTMDRGNPRKS